MVVKSQKSQPCEELNTVVKNDLKGIKKYISSNLNLDTKNIAYDAN